VIVSTPPVNDVTVPAGSPADGAGEVGEVPLAGPRAPENVSTRACLAWCLWCLWWCALATAGAASASADDVAAMMRIRFIVETSFDREKDGRLIVDVPWDTPEGANFTRIEQMSAKMWR
jgi:hypothetical protein